MQLPQTNYIHSNSTKACEQQCGVTALITAQDIREKNRVLNLSDKATWLKFDPGHQLCGCCAASEAIFLYLVSSSHTLDGRRTRRVYKGYDEQMYVEVKWNIWGVGLKSAHFTWVCKTGAMGEEAAAVVILLFCSFFQLLLFFHLILQKILLSKWFFQFVWKVSADF